MSPLRFTVSVASRALSNATASSSVTEIVGVEFRRTVGVVYQMFFSVGILFLPLLAYYISDWRWLQVVITVPYIVFLSYYW